MMENLTVPDIFRNTLVIKKSVRFVYSNDNAFQCNFFLNTFSLACNLSRHMTPSYNMLDFR